MASTGLLVLTTPLRSLTSQVHALLQLVKNHVNNVLYIHLQPTKQSFLLPVQSTADKFAFTELVSQIYTSAHNISHTLDVRILLDHVKTIGNQPRRTTKKQFDVILTTHQTAADVKQFLKNRFYQNLDNIPVVQLAAEINSHANSHHNGVENGFVEKEWKDYQCIVLGGTFDRLHSGHKILLSEALIRCSQQITVGVTEECMIKRKILYELIEPTAKRIKNVENFLEDVDPNVRHVVVPISNPFGPSVVDPNLQCIIVSEETLKGGKMVNDERRKKDLPELDLHMIQIYPDVCHAKEEEEKISSSSMRMRLLGKRYRNPEPRPDLPSLPYVIGFTGGIASGKSSICKRLEKLGMAPIFSDQLAHSTYIPGTDTYSKVIAEFGPDIVNPDGFINRRKLGEIVFANQSLLDKLNKIVWPEVEKLIKQEISRYAGLGKRIVLVENPVLIQSGMNRLTHEVWVSIIPKAEAITRIMNRDGLTAAQAEQRVNVQISNEAQVSVANVIFSTLWEPEVTQKQVETAWAELNEYLSEKSAQNTSSKMFT